MLKDRLLLFVQDARAALYQGNPNPNRQRSQPAVDYGPMRRDAETVSKTQSGKATARVKRAKKPHQVRNNFAEQEDRTTRRRAAGRASSFTGITATGATAAGVVSGFASAAALAAGIATAVVAFGCAWRAWQELSKEPKWEGQSSEWNKTLQWLKTTETWCNSFQASLNNIPSIEQQGLRLRLHQKLSNCNSTLVRTGVTDSLDKRVLVDLAILIRRA